MVILLHCYFWDCNGKGLKSGESFKAKRGTAQLVASHGDYHFEKHKEMVALPLEISRVAAF